MYLYLLMISWLVIECQAGPVVVITSWDRLLTSLIDNSRDPAGNVHIDRSAIIGLNGGAIYASSMGVGYLYSIIEVSIFCLVH